MKRLALKFDERWKRSRRRLLKTKDESTAEGAEERRGKILMIRVPLRPSASSAVEYLSIWSHMTVQRINQISGEIIDAAMKVHTALGPGLLESAYEGCLKHELTKRGLKVQSQVTLPVIYDGVRIDVGYRIDLLVEDAVIVELKAVERLTPLNEAPLLSYLKLSGRKLGLLINFNVERLKNGIKRIANGL